MDKSKNGENGGCVFTVWLASGDVTQMEIQPTSDTFVQQHSPAISDDSAHEKPLVFVVEDQNDLRRFIMQGLTGNYRTMGAPDGQQGFELATELSPSYFTKVFKKHYGYAPSEQN